MFKSSLILLALSLSLVRCEIVTFLYASGGTAPLIAPVLNTGTGTVQGYVPIESYAWGTSQSGTTHMGTGGGAGKANFQDLTLTKALDANTNTFLLYLAKASHLPALNLVIYKRSGSNLVILYSYQLSEIIISSVSNNWTGGASLEITESVTINFAKVTAIYGPPGSGNTASKFSWDIGANAQMN